jgi:hypothetical protein
LLSLSQIQTRPWIHTAWYEISTAGSFPGTMRPKSESDHSPPPNVRAEKARMFIYALSCHDDCIQEYIQYIQATWSSELQLPDPNMSVS